MSGSESEDDFMSDKFLAAASTSSAPQTYTAKRNQQALKSQRANIMNAKPVQKQSVREEHARREGLEKNLFENPPEGENKAMAMMMKMGWKPGEGMGKKKEASTGTKRDRDDEEEDEAPRGGIGSSSRPKLAKSPSPPQITEPIRISMWQRRKGLTARSPTPPPPPMQGPRDPDTLDAEKLAKLGRATDSFRDRQKRGFEVKEIERKSWKARERLVELDHAKGIMFHPLHVSPSAPNESIPKQLKCLLFPEYSPSPSPPPEGRQRDSANLSEAERMRAKIRREMLSAENGSDDEGDLAMGARRANVEREERKAQRVEDGIDWESHLSGVKRVLNEDPATYLDLVISQLRYEHLYCFWCATQYSSFPEMEGFGGCPGEDEDSH